MSKREKPRWQTIDHFFTKSVPSTHLPDDPSGTPRAFPQVKKTLGERREEFRMPDDPDK